MKEKLKLLESYGWDSSFTETMLANNEPIPNVYIHIRPDNIAMVDEITDNGEKLLKITLKNHVVVRLSKQRCSIYLNL